MGTVVNIFLFMDTTTVVRQAPCVVASLLGVSEGVVCVGRGDDDLSFTTVNSKYTAAARDSKSPFEPVRGLHCFPGPEKAAIERPRIDSLRPMPTCTSQTMSGCLAEWRVALFCNHQIVARPKRLSNIPAMEPI